MEERIISPVNIKPNKAERNKTKSEKKKFHTPYSVLEVHQKKMEYFDKLQKSIPEKMKELRELKQKEGCKVRIKELEKEIFDIKNKTEEIDYHAKTAILLTHYETFLKSPAMTPLDEETFKNICDDYYKSLGMMDKVSTQINHEPKTLDCECDASYEDISENLTVCRNCGITKEVLVINTLNTLSTRELECYNVTPVHFDYKRLTHLNDCLNQAQGKENTEIPQEIMDIIILQLQRERIYDLSRLTASDIKIILKKTGNSRYYEHIPYILGSLTGKYKVFPQEMIQEITKMFEEIQEPFEKYKPDDRKNFLSYKYCCYKLCQLLGYNEFLECFELLKSREKLRKQDDIWKKICEELEWEYIPTI